MAFTDLDDFLARAADRLDPVRGQGHLPEGGDLDMIETAQLPQIRRAAVLIPVIPRASGPTALLTLRPETMASHPGQVAFPGGKIEQGDADAVAAALREAEEEVGINPQQVELIARCAPYVSGSAFRITPVIGVLPADFVARPDPAEVAEVFEAPLDFLLRQANHRRASGVWKGRRREFTEMPWNGFRIWGVTAGIIRVLYETLYDPKEG